MMKDEDELKLEYIKALISYVNSRKKFTFFPITFNLAYITVGISEVFTIHNKIPHLVILSIIILLISTGLFVRHYHLLNKTEGEILEFILDLKTEDAKITISNINKKYPAWGVFSHLLRSLFMLIAYYKIIP